MDSSSIMSLLNKRESLVTLGVRAAMSINAVSSSTHISSSNGSQNAVKSARIVIVVVE